MDLKAEEIINVKTELQQIFLTPERVIEVINKRYELTVEDFPPLSKTEEKEATILRKELKKFKLHFEDQ